MLHTIWVVAFSFTSYGEAKLISIKFKKKKKRIENVMNSVLKNEK